MLACPSISVANSLDERIHDSGRLTTARKLIYHMRYNRAIRCTTCSVSTATEMLLLKAATLIMLCEFFDGRIASSTDVLHPRARIYRPTKQFYFPCRLKILLLHYHAWKCTIICHFQTKELDENFPGRDSPTFQDPIPFNTQGMKIRLHDYDTYEYESTPQGKCSLHLRLPV